MKYKEFALALLAAGLLAGCGVGTAANAPAAKFSGHISAGAPLSGGTLIVTDSSTPPRIFSTPVLADGSYSVEVGNGVAPFLFHAQGRNGGRAVDIYSASAAYGGKVDVSPLTSLTVANAAEQDCAVAACMPTSFSDTRLTEAGMLVQSQLSPLLTQFGLAIADALDSKQNKSVNTRKQVIFKHIAAGGYVYSGTPIEFSKDAATGNWLAADKRRITASAKAKKEVKTFVPLSGASSFGKWLPFAKDSSAYPFGATLIMVRGSGISPAVTLEYSGRENSVSKIAVAAVTEAVRGMSFLPACPRPVGQPGSCIEVVQVGNGEYTASFGGPADAGRKQAANNAKKPGA